MKKFLSMLICLSMILSLTGMPFALAADATTDGIPDSTVIYETNGNISVGCEYSLWNNYWIQFTPKGVNKLMQIYALYIDSKYAAKPTSAIATSESDWVGPVKFRADGSTDTTNEWTGGAHGWDDNTVASAYTESVTLKVDGVAVEKPADADLTVTGKVVEITVVNLLKAGNDRDGDYSLRETVVYTVSNNTIDVHTSLDALEDLKILTYYGLQSINGPYTLVSYRNGDPTPALEPGGYNTHSSGPKSEYPDVDRAVHKTADGDILEVTLDRSYGIGNLEYHKQPSSAVSETSKYNKTYFYQVLSNSTADALALKAGESVKWKGQYKFYKEASNAGEDFGDATEITTPEELAAISMDGNYVLKGKIELGSDWVPLGTADAPFAGTFKGADGSSVVLSGAPVFGTLSGATISDISLDGTVGGAYTGTLADSAIDCIISGIVNDAAISSTGAAVGGIVGSISGTTQISDCANTGAVATTADAAGGIVGKYGGSVQITGCANRGSVNALKKAAGIVAVYGGPKGTNFSVSECYNSGTITANNYDAKVAGIASTVVAGNISVQNCYNAGELVTNWNKAGIVYELGGVNEFSAGICSIAIVKNNYNAGVFKTPTLTSSAKIYNIIGDFINSNTAVIKAQGIEIGNNYYLAEASVGGINNDSFNVAGGIYEEPLSATAEDLYSLDNLGFDKTIWAVDPNAAYPYPTLINNPVIYPEGSKENPKKISDAEDFVALSGAEAGKYYVLTADIKLGEYTPFEFSANLDGAGHTITVNHTAGGTGIFSALKGNARISNLVIDGTVSLSGGTVGGLSGTSESSAVEIENVRNSAEISGKYAGGIIGAGGATFTGCANVGTIAGTEYTAGIIAHVTKETYVELSYNSGEIKGKYCGGIAGYLGANIAIANCYNTGAVSATPYGSNYSGGITAFPGKISLIMTNCYTVTARLVPEIDSSYIGRYVVTNSYQTGATVIASGVSTVTEDAIAKASLGDEFAVYDNYSYPQLKKNLHYFAEGTTGNPTPISNVAEFLAIADAPEKAYKLEADITLEDSAFIEEFSGYLDGQSYKITLKEHKGNGIFKILKGAFEIRNLVIEGSLDSASGNAGALAGTISSAEDALIYNVTNNADVKGTAYAGGIIGQGTSGTVTYEKVVNNGAVSTTSRGGGIVGQADGAKLTKCANNGAVSCQIAGGLIGCVAGNNNLDLTVEKSFNAGAVTSSTGGGLIGWLANRTFITDCYNVGTVYTGYGINGGITSYPQYQTGSKITNCFSTGSVPGGNYIAPAEWNDVDYTTFITTENCYYLSENENSDDGYEGTEAKTREEFKKLAEALGATFEDGSEASPFPQLKDNNRALEYNVSRAVITAGENGEVFPVGEYWVAKGDSLELSIAPAEGYTVGSVLKDGETELKDAIKGGKLVISVDGDITVSVSFAERSASAPSIETFGKLWYEADGSITFGKITHGYKTTVKGFGIGYSEEKSALEGWKGGNQEGIAIYEARCSKTTDSGFGIFLRGKKLPGKTYYTRTYLIYENENGETCTVLGDVIENIVK